MGTHPNVVPPRSLKLDLIVNDCKLARHVGEVLTTNQFLTVIATSVWQDFQIGSVAGGSNMRRITIR